VQGVHFYKHAPDDAFIPGLMHPRVGGYHVGDIEFSAAFDIDARKVGKDLSEAICSAEQHGEVRRRAAPRRDRAARA
jgi:myo-inositol-1-phosphate synthase